MSDFKVTGADDFLRLSKALKEAGETELRSGLSRGLRNATKPLIAQTRAATSRLPQRGGLAARVRRAPQRVQVLTGRDPGVRIVAGKKGSGARGADAGTVRHPVYGNRDRFVSQEVPAGWFTETLEQSAPTVLPHLEEAMEQVAQAVVRQGRS